jgi:hypothetical protein
MKAPFATSLPTGSYQQEEFRPVVIEKIGAAQYP